MIQPSQIGENAEMIQIYKPGQGKIVRLSMAFLIQAFIIYGCHQLYLWLYFTDDQGAPLWIASQFAYSEGLEMELTPRLLIAVGGFFFLTLSNFLLNNSQRFSDFLIDIHTELTKVSWSSREEVTKSSIVVLVVTAVFMLWIALLDYLFTGILRYVI